MKPITFESIRNLLKTKKKQKDKSSIDQSFKRSDSFKRISIRKSYLERGRKRNAAAVLRSSTKNLVNINEFENQAKVIKQPEKLVKSSGNNEASSSSVPKEVPSRPIHELTFEEKLESNDASLDEKIRALQEINDRYISENQNLVEQNFEAIKHVEKVKIKKPPRPSKQGLKKARETEVQITNPSDLKAKSSESINTLTSNDTIESNSRAKNISHVSITASDVIPEEDESTIYSYEPETQSTSRKAEDTDDKSFYSISTFTIESNTMNTTNASSRKSFRSSFSTSTKTTELPTLVTIKTYCEPNACIQSTTHVNERYLETSFDSYPEDTLTHNVSKSDILVAKSFSLNKAAISSNKANNETKTSSLKDVRPKINTQTFKMIRSKSREGIVIRIPAIDSDLNSRETNKTEFSRKETENLNRQLSNDSALDLIDVDIKVDEKDMRNKAVELKNQKNKYKKKLKKAAGKTATLDIDDCRNHTFKSHENFELERGCPSKERPEPKFIFPSKYFEEENNIFYDQTVYDEMEVPSPENSIPYALRIKENPFTKNKEFYSINTGRIWKQLNLGQEEDLSILSATPRLPVPKTKNESFKSMSSRDSGFSLTLTKPKNLFRRKSKKATLLQRRKPKLAVSKDGYFKRVMVVQRNSSKRKRSLRKARMQSKDIFRELYDENWVKLGDGFADQPAPDFARDFENFCNNRRYNQRIDDLEAFYEEHLKRLRHYYIQKKKLNEAAIKEFYKDYNGEDVEEGNDLYDSFMVSRNDTIRFKNHIQRKYFQEKEAENSMEFMFPHPDKRKANALAAKQKGKGKKHLFHEVRPYGSSVEPLNSMDLAVKEMEAVKELLKFKRSSSVGYTDANFQLLAPTKTNRALDELQHRKEGQVREISLASVFPSVNGKVKSGQAKNTAEEEDDDGEFSENEFLINSIGENLYCIRCDKVSSDCECYDDTTETTNDNSNDNDEEDECRGKAGAGDENMPEDDDDENYCDVHDYNDINIVHVNHKKKVKRKKSKKRVRKNHSTLRRGSYWGDITQKGYEKKRTRLLQPYLTKNAQQDRTLQQYHKLDLQILNAISANLFQCYFKGTSTLECSKYSVGTVALKSCLLGIILQNKRMHSHYNYFFCYSFLTAWYGCMFRGLVPLPIELPLSSSDSPPQQVGFLLSSCGVQVALTSEACLKGLPKSSTGEVAKLKGWPRLHWFVTEHLPKVPKDFNTNNNRINEDSIAYIEYTTDKDGSVMGVTVTRQSMINHCRALTMACHYTEGETIVCVLDFKREVGLWHSILTSVLNGMHVLFIPYALMKLKPSSWMQLITKYRASCCLVKSRDLHWGLLATKDHKEISLSSLRMLLVADGANPWSLSSCDQFLSVFQPKGLRADAICPCASSSEVFTVSLRRPGRSAGAYNQSASGRGVLSMAALSHGVVRVDSEDSLTSLTLQDCGQVMPSATMVVVNAEGPPVLCKTDQVGEICVTSGSTGTTYFGLDGMTNATFKVQPLTEPSPVKEGEVQTPGKPIGEESYVRSGLLGFLGPGGLVFVCGSRDGLMTVTGRKHNADDIIATVLAVEPVRFIYRGRIAVFSIKVLRDERVCVIAEQRPDCSEEESFQWMSRVLQAVDSIHQVGIYCLALVPPNHLPKTPLGGIHLTEARRRFLEGSLHPANVLMCPHTCVTNLPKPRELHHGSIQQLQISGTTPSSSTSINTAGTDASVGPASVMVGNLVQGNRLASAQGRDIGLADDNERKHQLITGVLRWRANSSPDHVLYTLLNSKGAVAKTLTCSELHKRAEKIAALLQERGKVNPGDHVALIFPPGLDLICAFYGCLYLGAVPVTIRPPHPQNLITTLPTVRMIVDVSKSGIILSIQSIIKLLKSREAATSIDPKSWPVILDIEDNPKRKLAAIANSTLDSTAYLDFSVSTCGRLSGVIITHRSLSSLCASLKLACELYPSRHVALCLDPYCGLGFSMWTLISVYSGHHSILIAPYEVEANPSLWLSTLSQYRVRDTFCSYGVIELCTKALSNSIQMLKQRNVNLGCVRTCVVVAEERPRVQLTQQFCKLFQALGLNTRCVSTSFGCRVNPAICVQGASSAESAQVYVDLRALRNNRVALVERGAPNSLCLVESGKLLPGVKVIIANPDSKGQCGDSHLGEIWVQSSHSSNGYFTIYGDETDYNDHFNAKLVTGCSISDTWARTGYLGFLRRTECSQAGSILDETTPSIASRDSDNESIHSQGHNTLNSTTSSNAGNTTIGGSGNEQELHDAVYIVGALDEVITLRGMYYHPIDIENSVLRCHKKIAECAVFTWTNLLVVVVELDGNESEALDLVPLVTNTVLEEHQLIVGVVVVVDPGVVPINSRGEKQRMHLRDGFLADQLDPIYVAYNM
ncbi:disco-interacting protein 2-like [Topomyia yanbarensis]|uniref:disco-interacting protein 2-like n=1 Tax=Topomyia yanbarensis TaxID=2498891 RepID=UPI00273AD2DE|nr:disco-interacting protein 2-like [Topomyia yanbarensis]